MSNLGATTLDDIYASLPDSRATVRIGQHIYPKAITSGAMLQRQESEQGTYNASEFNLRLPKSDEDNRFPLSIGKVIDVNHVGVGQFVKYRIMGRKDTAGIIMLQLEALYE